MRCAKKCFFFVVLAMQLEPTPEICFTQGQLRRTIFSKERYGDSLSVGETHTQPSNREADTASDLSPPQRNHRR